MPDLPEHLRVFDPNAKPAEEPAPPAPPPRTPSGVLGEFFRALVKRLGNHPEIEALLEEYEELTAPPKIEPPPEKSDEPIQ